MLLFLILGIFFVIIVKYTDSQTANNESYTIEYFGANCITTSLELHNDNTYKYTYGYYTTNNEFLFKTGQYHENIKKILTANRKKIETDYYQITSDNNIKYKIPADNNEMNNFLNSINVNLKTCYQAT